jgi:hypothetical protein
MVWLVSDFELEKFDPFVQTTTNAAYSKCSVIVLF